MSQDIPSLDTQDLISKSRSHMAALIAKGKGKMKTNGGYSFNVFSDTWVTGPIPADDKHDLSWMHQIHELHMQQSARMALGHAIQERESRRQFVGGIKRFIAECDGVINKETTQKCAAKWRIDYPNNNTYGIYIANIKVFTQALTTIDDQYASTAEAVSGISVPENPPLFMDVEKGVLSDGETIGLAKALNLHSQKLESGPVRSNLTKRGESESLQLIYDWRQFLALRLTQVTTRRPVQLGELKWQDFSIVRNPVGSAEPFSYFLQFYYRKAKETNPFRALPEDHAFPLIPEFAKELLHYQNLVFAELKARIDSRGISLSAKQWEEVRGNVPIFMNMELFTVGYSSPEEVTMAVAGQGFHGNKSMVRADRGECFSQLGLTSERTKKFKYTTNRQRHTTITRLLADGVPRQVIARVIGNLTTHAFRNYQDVDADTIRHINATMADGMEQVILAFQGRVVDELTNDLIPVKHLGRNGLSDQGGCGQCDECSLEKPFACYPCTTFRPIRQADHRGILTEAVDRYVQNRRLGVSHDHMQGLTNSIRWIAYTIAACEAVSRQAILAEISEVFSE